MDKISFQRCDADGARALRETVSMIHTDAYARRGKTEFDTDNAFMDRFDVYTNNSTFGMVIARNEDGEPVGQAWGWPLRAQTGWWRGLDT